MESRDDRREYILHDPGPMIIQLDPMFKARIDLVGQILQGLASRPEGLYFGIAEDALTVADATIALMHKGSLDSEH